MTQIFNTIIMEQEVINYCVVRDYRQSPVFTVRISRNANPFSVWECVAAFEDEAQAEELAAKYNAEVEDELERT